MLDITLLGTSALMPLPDRALTCVFLSCGGRSILFDCGEGTQSAARRARVSLFKTDLIALTHYHGDHLFGLPGLLQTLGCLGRTQPLTVTGPKGLAQALAPILTLAGTLPYPVHLLPFPEEGLSLSETFPGWPAGAVLTAFPTEHRVPSQGYAFTLHRPGKFLPERAAALGIPPQHWRVLQRGESVTVNGCTFSPQQVLSAPRRGLKFVFSGDTAACPALTEAASGADLFICEGTYGDPAQADLAASHGHMTFDQAAATAAAASVRRLWLAHYSQMIEEPSAFLPHAAALFPDAVCGEDGLHITLPFDSDNAPCPLF